MTPMKNKHVAKDPYRLKMSNMDNLGNGGFGAGVVRYVWPS